MTGFGESGRFATLRRRYVAAALNTFNVLLAIIVVNLLLWPVMALWPRPPRGDHNPSTFPRDRLAEVYGDLPMQVVEGTLNETWNLMKLEARPWVHYGEAPFKGTYVNVSAEGVRSNARPGEPSAPDGRAPYRIFMFGGSTMWGYGVPDWETIPAHLERLLKERNPDRAFEVRNYGRGFYYSTQESALFQSLVRRGIKPDAAVFLDGLNEMSAAYVTGEHLIRDEPIRMENLRKMWLRQEEARTDKFRLLPNWLPMVELADRLGGYLKGPRRAPLAAGSGTRGPEGSLQEDEAWIRSLYLRNKRVIELVAAENGIKPYLFWQPVPQYAYDLSKHPFAHQYSQRGDAVLRLLYEDVARSEIGVVNIAELLRNYNRPAFVDAHHYTPEVSRMIAGEIAERILIKARDEALEPASRLR